MERKPNTCQTWFQWQLFHRLKLTIVCYIAHESHAIQRALVWVLLIHARRAQKLIGYKSEIGCFCIIFHIVGFSDELRVCVRACVWVSEWARKCLLYMRLKANWKWQSGIALSRNCRKMYIHVVDIYPFQPNVYFYVSVCEWCIFIEMTVTYGFRHPTWNQWLNNSYTHQHFMNAMKFQIKRNHEWMCVCVFVRASNKVASDSYSCWFLSRSKEKKPTNNLPNERRWLICFEPMLEYSSYYFRATTRDFSFQGRLNHVQSQLLRVHHQPIQ